VTLEDGSAIAFGGDATGAVSRYSPTSDAWETVAPAASGDQPGTLDGPSTALLPDGSVLVMSGTGSWIYRPSLIGPTTGGVTVLPQAPIRGAALVASDPGTLSRAGGYTLTSPDDRLRARALVGGPVLARGSIAATVHGVATGFALIAQQTAPGHAVIAELVNGEKPTLRRADGTTLCRASKTVELGTGPITARLAITSDGSTLTVDDVVVLSCDSAPGDTGAWGVAALGTNGAVSIDAVTIARK
jgi:hypothetical protein